MELYIDLFLHLMSPVSETIELITTTTTTTTTIYCTYTSHTMHHVVEIDFMSVEHQQDMVNSVHRQGRPRDKCHMRRESRRNNHAYCVHCAMNGNHQR
mmetsp:Transcript_16625/g.29128  ORF Transcript_16625/g.29128 Transcript_16625/m.29128 type:complete len:98 (+) Transcript_16625:513-806(+)